MSYIFMNSNELFTLKSIELNTPIYNYPSVINDNFKFVMDKVSMFYTNSNANFPEKESGNALIAPINNKYVKSNTGKFNNVITDNLTVSSSFNVDGVSFDKIITEQRLDSGSFLIDSSTGKVSIKRDEATLYSCPIEADIKGNLKIGKGVKIYDNDTCVDNIGIGDKNTLLSIGYQNSSDYNGSSYNIAIGAQSLQKLIGGSGNIVLGATSMVDLTTGSGNIVLGSNLCNGISSSQDMLYIGNSGVGTFIKGNMKSGEFLLNNPNSSLKYVNDILLSSINLENIIIGRNNTLKLNYLSGSDNILIGNDISDNITGGMKNIFIGTNSGYRYFDNINYNIAIGVVDTEEGIDEPLLNGNMKSKLLEVNTTSLFINGDIRVSPNFKSSGSGTAIGLDSNNHIVKFTSSKRYKTNIQTLSDIDSECLYDIRCISYEPTEKDGNIYYGFIAEEVEKVNNKLVSYTETHNGKIVDSVQYDRFVVLLLNEIKKQKKTISELSDKIDKIIKK